MRGGHQLCLDSEARRAYLFGGWDGFHDLDDLWMFDIASESWVELAEHTAGAGPSPRSCHKMCLDTRHKRLYTLGHYLEHEWRSSTPSGGLAGDFYVYHILENRWEAISMDTESDGGPGLIYDHQMCLDSEKQLLYVFGGRVLSVNPTSSNDSTYSGLFRFDLVARTWSQVRGDDRTLRSRIGHSMLLHDERLYIFAGQRHKDYLSDFYVYDLGTDRVREVSRDSSRQGGPDAGFTQRATLDPGKGEIYVFSGLMREKASPAGSVKNSFWVYHIASDRWSNVIPEDGSEEPCPRYAHQLVYDRPAGTHYLFGGNPGEGSAVMRLDDLWSLTLHRPSADDVLRRALFLVRRCRFMDMEDGQAALKYLWEEVAQVAPDDRGEFEGLVYERLVATSAGRLAKRKAAWNDIQLIFADSLTEPRKDLLQL